MYRGNPTALVALKDRRIVVGMGGGIACYKIASLVSTLAQAGAVVEVVMTDAAQRFVTPLTFESLSGRVVHTSIWQQEGERDPQHIRLAKAADAMLIAPCTMDLLAKLVQGMADDPVTLIASAIDRRSQPVVLAPSMNEVMWSQPATQRNAEQAARDGFVVLEPGSGWQACRAVGPGRLPEPDDLVEVLAAVVTGSRG